MYAMATSKETKKSKQLPHHVAKKHLSKLEEKMAKQSKTMPQMTPASRRAMIKLLPWASGFFALISFAWAKDLWDALQAIKEIKNYLNVTELNIPYVGDTLELWVLLIGYSVITVLIIAAFVSGITKTLKKGWDYLFYAYSAAVVTGVLYLLLLSAYSSSRAILTIAVGFVGLYVLFQLRDEHK
jgi:hypothetical protein